MTEPLEKRACEVAVYMIETGATVRNCILMEGSIVRKGAVLENVVLDKKVTVSEGRVLRGAPTYPLYVNKGRTI